MEWEGYFSRYKNKILNGAIIVLALIIANNIYKVQFNTIESLKSSREKESKKNIVLGEISQFDKRLKAYKSFLNKKDMSLVIDNISNIAKDSNVRILSLRPDLGQAFPLYIKYTFNLAVILNDYATLGKFISKLENSYDVYMVEGLVVNPRFEGSEETALKGLSVNLKISTFLFND